MSIPMPIFIFGYGSLGNEDNLRKVHGDDLSIERRVKLNGFTRTFDKPGLTHLYSNIRAKKGATVHGSIFTITTQGQLKRLQDKEPGYALVDVSEHVEGGPLDRPVFAFIAGDMKKVRRSYLERCMAGLTDEEKREWIAETEFPDGLEIDDDAQIIHSALIPSNG